MNSAHSYKDFFLFILSVAIILEIAVGMGHEYLKIKHARDIALQELEVTRRAYASSTAALSQNIDLLHDLNQRLLSTEEEKSSLAEKLNAEQTIIDNMQAQISAVTGTVGTLQKLSETDKELLQKYSRIYFLNENFIPKDLTMIPKEVTLEPAKEIKILKNVLPFLLRMISDAKQDQVDLLVVSAYRSFWEQSTLKATYKITYGAGTANKFSADQGYSEHQLGTTVDFTSQKLGANFTRIEKDPAYAWLTEHAYQYGFVISYPKQNTYYTFEPWHWRFVGTALATRLHDEKKNFYDLDQREIDKYLVSIFDE